MKSKRSRRSGPASGRHRRKCTICNHSKREAIDRAFLERVPPGLIAAHFKLSGRSAIYRHAEATGLGSRRRSAATLLSRGTRASAAARLREAIAAAGSRKARGKKR